MSTIGIIGLGIMGFADALFKMGIPYNSVEGLRVGSEFMRVVNEEAHDESERIALKLFVLVAIFLTHKSLLSSDVCNTRYL